MESKKVKFSLRLTEELAKKVTQKAKEIGVSANAYIAMVLSEKVK
jgi:predicted HicB family RNase H-like nuclease